MLYQKWQDGGIGMGRNPIFGSVPSFNRGQLPYLLSLRSGIQVLINYLISAGSPLIPRPVKWHNVDFSLILSYTSIWGRLMTSDQSPHCCQSLRGSKTTSLIAQLCLMFCLLNLFSKPNYHWCAYKATLLAISKSEINHGNCAQIFMCAGHVCRESLCIPFSTNQRYFLYQISSLSAIVSLRQRVVRFYLTLINIHFCHAYNTTRKLMSTKSYRKKWNCWEPLPIYTLNMSGSLGNSFSVENNWFKTNSDWSNFRRLDRNRGKLCPIYK